MRLRSDEIARRLSRLPLRNGVSVFVINPADTIIFDSGGDVLHAGQRMTASFAEAIAAVRGNEEATSKLREQLGGSAALLKLVQARSGWIVGTMASPDATFGDFEQVRNVQLVALALVAVIALLAALGMASYVANRLEVLLLATSAIESGNPAERAVLAPPVPPSGGDEVDELTRAFVRMADRLHTENQRRHTFISAIAHDLKNLTTPLSLTAQIISDPGLAPPGSQRRLAARLSYQVNRLQRLVGDLLDSSRIDSGHFTMERQQADLAAVVRAVVDEHRAVSDRHTFVVDAPPRVDAYIDADRIAQVLTNLISNGVKYSPVGGDVMVSLRVKGASAVIEVTDDGIGLDADEAASLFNPFARGRGVAEIRGIGLGLYISRSIVAAHGGELVAFSAGKGKGTTFRISLPLRAAPLDAVAAASEQRELDFPPSAH